ncbi:MAG: MazG family protein [Elusimicrobia bacterium]|jgi:tetrapyrrole methylase family protein/MazG family protein|nr:MazG family protein [Elusimicrobiota bacterium]
MDNKTELLFTELVKLCDLLRGPDGCMWDKEQSHESLAPFLKEETQEVIDAIKNKDTLNLQEELGDLLYQIIFHSQIAKEKGEFNINEVLEGIIKKLTRRHPHVFGDTKVSSTEEILENWKKIKEKEKENKKGTV